VHDHLKRHLVSTRDKYSYVDPDLVVLYDAEASARGEVRPPLRKRRRTVNKDNQTSAPRSPPPSLSPPPFNDPAIDVAEPFVAHLQSTSIVPSVYNVGYARFAAPAIEPRISPRIRTPQPVDRISGPQSPVQVGLAHVQHPQLPQRSHGRFEIEMGDSRMTNREFLMTLHDDLVAKGHQLRPVGNIFKCQECQPEPRFARTSLCAHRYGRSSWESRRLILPGTINTSIKGPLQSILIFAFVLEGEHGSFQYLGDILTEHLSLSIRESSGYSTFFSIVQDKALVRLMNAYAWLRRETMVGPSLPFHTPGIDLNEPALSYIYSPSIGLCPFISVFRTQ
jgi:hypothetical protein